MNVNDFADPRQPAAITGHGDTAAHAGMPLQHLPTENMNDLIQFELESRQPVHHPQDDSEAIITMVTPNATHRLQKSFLKTPLDETGPSKPDELVL